MDHLVRWSSLQPIMAICFEVWWPWFTIFRHISDPHSPWAIKDWMSCQWWMELSIRHIFQRGFSTTNQIPYNHPLSHLWSHPLFHIIPISPIGESRLDVISPSKNLLIFPLFSRTWEDEKQLTASFGHSGRRGGNVSIFLGMRAQTMFSGKPRELIC